MYHTPSHSPDAVENLGATRPADRRADEAAFRLWFLSDLRVDLGHCALPAAPSACDALLVAGNVGPGAAASVRWLARALGERSRPGRVIFVPGPVEFGDGVPVPDGIDQAVRAGRELGIEVLHDDAIRVGGGTDGLHVIGATLWTDFAIDGPDTAQAARGHARLRWYMHGRASSAPGRPYLPYDAAGAHARSRAYIEDALACLAVGAGLYGRSQEPVLPGVRPGDKAVVVTAYPPSRACLPPELARPLLDPWRVAWHASALDPILDRWSAPAAWVHGGVPCAIDMRLGRTRVVANPRQRGDPRAGFDPLRSISI